MLLKKSLAIGNGNNKLAPEVNVCDCFGGSGPPVPRPLDPRIENTDKMHFIVVYTICSDSYNL